MSLITISRKKVAAGTVMIVVSFIFCCTCPVLQAQTDVFFNTSDKFLIPRYNGSISFAVNGSYANATLEDGSWIFTGLHLDGSQTLENLQFSAQNSNVTIISFRAASTVVQSERLSYSVKGQGKQVINIGTGSGYGSNADWSVNSNNTFLEKDWSVSHGTVTVTGLTGNISIVYYNFTGAFGNSSTMPLYQQHSVAIAAAIGVAITVVVAAAIKVRSKENQAKGKNTQLANVNRLKSTKESA